MKLFLSLLFIGLISSVFSKGTDGSSSQVFAKDLAKLLSDIQRDNKDLISRYESFKELTKDLNEEDLRNSRARFTTKMIEKVKESVGMIGLAKEWIQMIDSDEEQESKELIGIDNDLENSLNGFQNVVNMLVNDLSSLQEFNISSEGGVYVVIQEKINEFELIVNRVKKLANMSE